MKKLFCLALCVIALAQSAVQAAEEVALEGYSVNTYTIEKPLGSYWIFSYPPPKTTMSILIEFEKEIEIVSVTILPIAEKDRTTTIGTRYIVTARRRDSFTTETFQLQSPVDPTYRVIWNGRSKEALQKKVDYVNENLRKKK